jgi:hypothetical protein
MHHAFVFRRPATNKALGCAMYALLLPIAAVFVFGMAFGLAVAIGHGAGLPGGFALAVGLLIALPLLGGVVLFGVRDYQRRANLELLVDEDRLRLTRGPESQVLLFSEIRGIERVPHRGNVCCRVSMLDGRRIVLPPEVATFDRVRTALEATLVPVLSERLDARLATGETVSSKVPAKYAVTTMMRGMGRIVIAAAIFLTLKVYLALGLLNGGRKLFVDGYRSLGPGVTVHFDGLMPTNDPFVDPVKWEWLVVKQETGAGLVLESDFGERFYVPELAPNSWVLGYWIREQLAKHGRPRHEF